VSMSGRTAPEGGWLVRIADRGQGLPEEQVRQLNELLTQPTLADASVARHMGLFAVAHLAARHGIRVQIMQPPGGGTTVEIHIPAVLISQAAEPGGQTGAAVGFPWAGASVEAAAVAARPDPRFSAPRFAPAPQPVLEPGPDAGTDVVRRDAVPFLGAPMPSLAPASPLAETGPVTVGVESAGLPIFDSVEVEYFGPRRDDQATSMAGPPAADPGPSTAAAADATAAGGPTPAGLPRRRRQVSVVPDSVAAEREAKPADDE
jgi:Histidine kinase-, DNA gyrase B-, and HSP90-like ATPase